MSVTSAYLKNRACALLAAAALCCAATSCDSAIYEDEGDCSTTYRVTFRYDRNMVFADAFPSGAVKSVRLYAFDVGGTLVWQQSERGEALQADGYSMTLDLPAGDYRLVAWCGLDNEAGSGETFTLPATVVGRTRIEELRCAMSRDRGASGEAVSKAKLYPLFHGMRDVSLPAAADGGDFTYEMELTKNTNHVRVILQQLSGEPVSADDFNFSIVEANGLMNYDNTLLPDETIHYQAYSTSEGVANLGIDDYPVKGSAASKSAAPGASRDISSVSVAIADLSIARLMADRDAILVIEPKNGGHVDRIPLTDYALMLKDGEQMSDQDYLDRQDEYAMTLFLDEDRKWIGTSIIINAWKLVINNVDFGTEEPTD